MEHTKIKKQLTRHILDKTTCGELSHILNNIQLQGNFKFLEMCVDAMCKQSPTFKELCETPTTFLEDSTISNALSSMKDDLVDFRYVMNSISPMNKDVIDFDNQKAVEDVPRFFVNYDTFPIFCAETGEEIYIEFKAMFHNERFYSFTSKYYEMCWRRTPKTHRYYNDGTCVVAIPVNDIISVEGDRTMFYHGSDKKWILNSDLMYCKEFAQGAKKADIL